MQELTTVEIDEVGGGIAAGLAFLAFWAVAYAGEALGLWEVG